MGLTHEEFQKARRISREIQTYLESINSDGVRSTDLYPVLARKNLVEKDKDNGVHFRKFLRYLYEMGVLESLIPQCKPQRNANSDIFMEWYFYRVHQEECLPAEPNNEYREIKMPELTDIEIDELIKQARPHIERLPKREMSDFTFPQIETRKLYSRAYEFWSTGEIEIMTKAYAKFKKVDKVAELLKRQPSAVRRKLEELNIEK